MVTENSYGMLKGRFRISYKKTDCRLKNLKYVIIACVMLHNFCISVRDPCLPCWRLQLKQACKRKEDKENASELNLLKIVKLAMEQLSNILFLHDI